MTRTDPEVRRIYRNSPKAARLIRLATLAGINLGRAIYGERAGFLGVTHRVKRHGDLVRAYAEEHARESIEHAKGMVT